MFKFNKRLLYSVHFVVNCSQKLKIDNTVHAVNNNCQVIKSVTFLKSLSPSCISVAIGGQMALICEGKTPSGIQAERYKSLELSISTCRFHPRRSYLLQSLEARAEGRGYSGQVDVCFFR